MDRNAFGPSQPGWITGYRIGEDQSAGFMEVMTMQSDNKGDSLTDNLWAEMSLMMVLVVIVLALAWRYVW
jgi:hypothetical protein